MFILTNVELDAEKKTEFKRAENRQKILIARKIENDTTRDAERMNLLCTRSAHCRPVRLLFTQRNRLK